MKEVKEASKKWKEALISGNTDDITALYDNEAVLWGTLSPVIRNSPKLIREYFMSFITLEDIHVEFHDSEVRQFGEIAINTGYYTFSWMKDGKKVCVPGRYSFVYKFHKDWKIIDHHSSVIPDEPLDLSKYICE